VDFNGENVDDVIVSMPIISFASRIGAIFSVDLYASFNETKKRKRKVKAIMRRFTPMNGVIIRARKSAHITNRSQKTPKDSKWNQVVLTSSFVNMAASNLTVYVAYKNQYLSLYFLTGGI
jgi:hypothetical protein